MYEKISETQPVLDVINLATKYCQLIENRDNETVTQILQESFLLLSRLCACAAILPEVDTSDYTVPRTISDDEWKGIFDSLCHKLGEYDCFFAVYDPYSKKDHNPIDDSLARNLTEIYDDLVKDVRAWGTATAAEKLEVIWDLRFGFEDHWGHHATMAIYTLYALLYMHIENEED